MTSLMFPQQCGSQRTAHWSLCAPSTLDPVDWTGSSRLAASTFTSQSLRSLLISLDASWSLCLRLEGGGGTFFQNGVHLCSVWQPRTLNCSQAALSVGDSFAGPAAGRPCDPLLTLPLLPTPHLSFASKLWEHFSTNEICVVLGICKSQHFTGTPERKRDNRL